MLLENDAEVFGHETHSEMDIKTEVPNEMDNQFQEDVDVEEEKIEAHSGVDTKVKGER